MAIITQLADQAVTHSGVRDEGWFTAMYLAHYRDVVRYGHRRLGDLDASTELAQDVFVVAWRRRARVPDRSPALAVRGGPAVALARLSERDREVLRLAAWEQLTIAELAVALRTSQAAAKVRLHRARRRSHRQGRLVIAAVAATAAAAVLVPYAWLAHRDGPGPPPGASAGPPPAEPSWPPTTIEITGDAPPAGPHLRSLAANLADAPYDGHHGRFA
jgi:RNA polymerase sigma-70 factor (ECF subfamily)